MTARATGFDFDFAVAGGGPAGSSAAISLAQRGHRVVLFESERFPRFHIGESLLSTANDAVASLGVRPQVGRPQTWQVCRERFDQILLDRAREAGVEVREGWRVTGCEFAADAATVDAAPDSAAKSSPAISSSEISPDTARRTRVRAIVDATGRHGLIARKFGLRVDEPRLANIAIYSHYSGVPRLEGDRPNDIRLIARADAGWFWFIPISDDLMSVGVVLPKRLFQSMPAGSNEERLERAIADTPVAAELMRDARRAWPVRAEKDFSYSASAYAGDRWLLAGDAGSFLDPVFSTGVSIAMESGIEAADELCRSMASGDFSARAFAAFSSRQRRRFELFRRYVIGFYTPEFRDRFFTPNPPEWIFRSVVTVLAGNWDPDPWNRFLGRVFFASIAIQKRFPRGKTRFRRDAAAGYPEA
jgi:halogenation protein CepH